MGDIKLSVFASVRLVCTSGRTAEWIWLNILYKDGTQVYPRQCVSRFGGDAHLKGPARGAENLPWGDTVSVSH